MKAKDLIDKLQEFNPDAEIVVNILGERYDVTGIWSWSAYPGESSGPRDIQKEKSLTRRITLNTEMSKPEEE